MFASAAETALGLDFLLLSMATATPPAAPATRHKMIHFLLPEKPPEPELEIVTAGGSFSGTLAMLPDFLEII